MAHSTFRTEGEWDFTVIGDSGRVWFIEAKTRIGKLSTAQLAIHAWAKKLGRTVHVVRSFEAFLAVVDTR
jgi:streptogramin lyase